MRRLFLDNSSIFERAKKIAAVTAQILLLIVRMVNIIA